jgi:hypothetical protein
MCPDEFCYLVCQGGSERSRSNVARARRWRLLHRRCADRACPSDRCTAVTVHRRSGYSHCAAARAMASLAQLRKPVTLRITSHRTAKWAIPSIPIATAAEGDRGFPADHVKIASRHGIGLGQNGDTHRQGFVGRLEVENTGTDAGSVSFEELLCQVGHRSSPGSHDCTLRQDGRDPIGTGCDRWTTAIFVVAEPHIRQATGLPWRSTPRSACLTWLSLRPSYT